MRRARSRPTLAYLLSTRVVLAPAEPVLDAAGRGPSSSGYWHLQQPFRRSHWPLGCRNRRHPRQLATMRPALPPGLERRGDGDDFNVTFVTYGGRFVGVPLVGAGAQAVVPGPQLRHRQANSFR